MLYVSFFFFKQKTAYEMRISDWSSDVCSSDLPRGLIAGNDAADRRRDDEIDLPERLADRLGQRAAQPFGARGILKHAHLLEENGRVQPRRQDEMPLEQRIRATELVEHFVWGHRRTSSLQSASVQYEAPGGRATDVPKIARLALETPDTAAYRPSQKGISRSSRLG